MLCRAPIRFAIVLAVPGWVHGQGDVVGVIQHAGQPIENARMTLFTPSLSFFRETRSGPGGWYEFSSVPTGQYALGVAARGLDYEQRTVSVVTNLREDFTLEIESHPGRWDVIGTTLPEFLDATDIALLMLDGRIFFCHDTTDPIIFDPVTGQKSFPPSSGSPQGCMNGTLLNDGRIILAGGQEGASPGSFRNAVSWVKAYDAINSTWTQLPEMKHDMGRWYPGLARLSDGSLLAMGGGTRPNATRTETCERLDLNTMQWSYTGSMLNPSEFSPSALLYTGEVLATWSPPQLYDPSTGVWRATGGFVQPDRGWPGHSDHSIVVLEDGRVLAMGVRGSGTAMGEIYDPISEFWSTTSSPDLLRFQCEVEQLPDGHVLVAGGEAANPGSEPNVLGIVARGDLYDPATDSWRRVDSQSRFAEYHAVTMLVPDGRVVTTGGTRIKFQIGPTSADIEAFSPPYLFRGIRPEITAVSRVALSRGQTLALNISPVTTITSVVLMGMQSHTHWVSAGVPRRLELTVDQTGSTVRFRLPEDPDVLPIGGYMLFAMVDDIPSQARIVQVLGACYADCDQSTGSGILDLFDFLCFQNSFVSADPYACDCDTSTGPLVCDLFDFLCFQDAFVGGCP